MKELKMHYYKNAVVMLLFLALMEGLVVLFFTYLEMFPKAGMVSRIFIFIIGCIGAAYIIYFIKGLRQDSLKEIKEGASGEKGIPLELAETDFIAATEISSSLWVGMQAIYLTTKSYCNVLHLMLS